MGLKSGATSYRQSQVVTRRHQTRQVVGENYQERHVFKAQLRDVEAPRSGFISRVRDFFLGPRLPDVNEFAPRAAYVRGLTIGEQHRMLEQGINPVGVATDRELIEILNSVESAIIK